MRLCLRCTMRRLLPEQHLQITLRAMGVIRIIALVLLPLRRNDPDTERRQQVHACLDRFKRFRFVRYAKFDNDYFLPNSCIAGFKSESMRGRTCGKRRSSIPFEVVDKPATLARHTQHQVCSRLRNDNVETRCEIRDCVPVSLLTDVEWVWQILMNLITNAAKYTYKGHINVYVDYRDAHLELRVEDTGIGIDDSHKEAVFDQYVTHQKYGHISHGIGLHSVKMKVDALGGSCEISDNIGGGSIFEVWHETNAHDAELLVCGKYRTALWRQHFDV